MKTAGAASERPLKGVIATLCRGEPTDDSPRARKRLLLAAASSEGTGRIDRVSTLFDMRNATLGVNYECRTGRYAALLNEDSVIFRSFALSKITQQGIANAQLFGPVPESRTIVGAYKQHLCSSVFEFCDTSLVRFDFPRSTTGKGRWEEAHNDLLFTQVIGKRNRSPRRRRQREVRRFVADLEVGRGKGIRHGEREEQQYKSFH